MTYRSACGPAAAGLAAAGLAAALLTTACTVPGPAPHSPSATSLARPARAAAAATGRDLPACSAARLTVTLTHSRGAVTGEVGGYLRFENIGHAACRLSGWPAVTAVTGSGQKIAAGRAAHGTMLGAWHDTVPLPVTRLAPGGAAYAVLAAGDHGADGAGRCAAVRYLLVAPPGSTTQVRLPARLYGRVDLPACTSADGSTEIEVSAVVPLAALAH